MVMVDRHLERKGYFGRIMQSCHRVSRREVLERRDKRIEKVPLDGDGIELRFREHCSTPKTHRSLHRLQGASVTMVSSSDSPFRVCQDRGERERERLAICWSRSPIGGGAAMCIACICSRQPGPYRGTSYDMNHLVALAEIEMSCFIRAHQYWTISGNAVKWNGLDEREVV